MKQRKLSTVLVGLLILSSLVLSACRQDLGQDIPSLAPAGSLNNAAETVIEIPSVDTASDAYPVADPATLDTTATGDQPVEAAPAEEAAPAAEEVAPAVEAPAEEAAPAVEEAPVQPEAQPTGEQATVIHVVQGGETIGAIADRYGVTIDDILAANDIFNVNLISIGQELRIESGAAAQQVQQNSAESGFTGYDPNNYFIHTVGFGDTLFVLAQRYGFTVEELAAYNGLSDINRIDLNQEIRIPNR